VGVHVPDHFFQEVGREHVTKNVEDFAGATWVEVVFDGLDALEKLLEDSAFASVGGDEIENETVLFLAVAVDAAHALLQPDGIPRDVVVDHEPAELEVDAFARRFGSNHDLGGLAKLAFGVNAGAGCVAVADFHAAVDLSGGQAPLDQPAERTIILAVAYEEIECVFVLGEDEELHLRVFEYAVLGEELAKFDELGFDFGFSSWRAWSMRRPSSTIS